MSESKQAAVSAGGSEFDAIIVGAGVSGLYALHRLRGMGMSVRLYEAGSDVGGTWYWNRYPGCRCDVESMEYSYAFDSDLQQEWEWPERYGTQPEILRYVKHVAERYDLRRDIVFNTRIVRAVFNEAAERWVLTTEAGDTLTAAFCIMATGSLSTPRVPDFKGLESFQGKWYHTGLWPHEGVDFTGLRVGVIGTGSSGVQSIPIIARQAKHLTVFQRTPQFTLPARNGPMDRQKEAEHKAEYDARRLAAYDTPFGIAGYPPPAKNALEDTAEERRRAYEAKWAEGGSISFLYTYKDLLVNKEANDTAADFVREKIRATVKNPQTAEKLIPYDHPIGTKRLILDTGYYETYNRDNVSLVDVRAAPIEEITAKGLRTADGQEYELDAIVFATGFDAMTGALREIDLQNGRGLTIREKWADGPHCFLGLAMAGFPNLFTITGPQSPSVKTQMILAGQQHTDWIVDCLAYMRANGYSRFEVGQAAEDAWVEHNNQVANSTLYPLANSWYMGANIPGKPRVFMPYVGGFDRFTRTCDEIAAKGYEGIRMTGKAKAVAAE
jgi:cyclohexanone monooxygenase